MSTILRSWSCTQYDAVLSRRWNWGEVGTAACLTVATSERRGGPRASRGPPRAVRDQRNTRRSHAPRLSSAARHDPSVRDSILRMKNRGREGLREGRVMKAINVSLRVIPILAALCLAAALGSVASAQGDRVGTWELNLAKSTFSPGPALKRQILTFQAAGPQWMALVQGIDCHHLRWKGPCDEYG